MSLYRKLIGLLLVATVVPFVLLALGVIRTAEGALRPSLLEAQLEIARGEASRTNAFIKEHAEAVARSVDAFDLRQASLEELTGAARIVYLSDPNVTLVVVLNEDGGLEAPPAIRPDLSQLGPADPLAEHLPAQPEDAQRLIRGIDREGAVSQGAGGLLMTPAYLQASRGDASIALIKPVHGPNNKLLLFAVEISLARLSIPLSHQSDVTVVDADSRVLAAVNTKRLTTVDIRVAAIKNRRLTTMMETVVGDTPVLLAHAPVGYGNLQWMVVASVDIETALAPIRALRVKMLAAFGGVLGLLLALSLVFVRGLRRTLSGITDVAGAFGRGTLDRRIDPLPREKELNELADTFNRMGDELLRARTKLETWNEELERTVELRTRELKEAQARLLETRKLAAVGALGAGVAHEINNPLATVLGTAQNLILKKKKAGVADDDPELVSMLKVEKAAKRCRDITTTLLRFSQRSEEARKDVLELPRVVDDAVAMTRADVEGGGATLTVSHAAPPATVKGDTGQLVQVLVHLLKNATTALLNKKDGHVHVETGRRDGMAFFAVQDDGKGIDPSIRDRIFEPFFTTKDVWQNLGLGLSESFRIVEDHGGRIEVHSEPGQGARFTVLLPDAGEVHA